MNYALMIAIVTLLFSLVAGAALGGWRVALATVISSDYTPDEQLDDIWRFGSVIPTKRGRDWRDTLDCRHVTDTITFVDRNGAERFTEVTRYVYAGTSPSDRYPILYRGSDPDSAMTFWPTSGLDLIIAGIRFGFCVFRAGRTP